MFSSGSISHTETRTLLSTKLEVREREKYCFNELFAEEISLSLPSLITGPVHSIYRRYDITLWILVIHTVFSPKWCSSTISTGQLLIDIEDMRPGDILGEPVVAFLCHKLFSLV